MNEDLRASLLASIIIEEYKKLDDEQRIQLQDSPKPIRDLCALLIDKYGHENFRKTYVHEAETWEKAFKLVNENLKEL